MLTKKLSLFRFMERSQRLILKPQNISLIEVFNDEFKNKEMIVIEVDLWGVSRVCERCDDRSILVFCCVLIYKELRY